MKTHLSQYEMQQRITTIANTIAVLFVFFMMLRARFSGSAQATGYVIFGIVGLSLLGYMLYAYRNYGVPLNKRRLITIAILLLILMATELFPSLADRINGLLY